MHNSSRQPQQPSPDEKTLSGDEESINGNDSNIIFFKQGDKDCCHEINGRHVKVIGSNGNHDHGSSKVKLKNVVDYKWEPKHYPGHLIAAHIGGKHIAYAINVNNKFARMEGMIRVVNSALGTRALIKGLAGEVLDLQFAHIKNEYILASIDLNSLFIHKIDEEQGSMNCNLVIKIDDPLNNYTPRYDKISWCPYIDDANDDDDDSKLIVWARGSIFQCFNIKTIVETHGKGKTMLPENINVGYLKFNDKSLTITWVALSPDGSTLGVGSTDGVIRFYQVYMHDKEPRCLHQWNPHEGKPVSSFFFLDNLTKNVTDTYWKYAVTGAANNTELKIWDCGSWKCLQTLTITINRDDTKNLNFIAELDFTSSYLVISSLDTRTCYVLQIINTTPVDSDTENICKISSNSSTEGGLSDSYSNSKLASFVYFKSISEFPLSSGILSFSIIDAAVRRCKCVNDNYLGDDMDDYDEEINSIFCVVVRMYVVQSKSLQECHILYQPTVTENTEVRSSISNDSPPNGSLLEEVTEKDNENSNNDVDDEVDLDEEIDDVDIDDDDDVPKK